MYNQYSDIGIDVPEEIPIKFTERPVFDYEDFEEDDDENGIKEKLAKRYNSLTSLLMKSFRKAKKKKKEQMQRMVNATGNVNNGAAAEVASLSTGDVKLIEKTNFEDRSEYRHHQQPQPLPRTTTGTKLINDCKLLTSSIVSQTQSVYVSRGGSIKSNLSNNTSPSVLPMCNEKGFNVEECGDPESTPIFIGAKVILGINYIYRNYILLERKKGFNI